MNDLRSRTRQLALRIIRVCNALPPGRASNVIGYQLLRAGLSVGAQFREGIRSRSNAELISKTGSALQELEESAYWLELLVEGEIVSARKLAALRSEVNELTALLVTCVKKLKAKR